MALKKVVYLSDEDYNTLITDGSVTVNGTTITYSTDDIYLTPDNTAEKFAELQTSIEGLQTALDAKKLYRHRIYGIANVAVIDDVQMSSVDFVIIIENDISGSMSDVIANAAEMNLEHRIQVSAYSTTEQKHVYFDGVTRDSIDMGAGAVQIYMRPYNDDIIILDGTWTVTDTVTEIL